jgi:hypothetical protein
MPFRNAATRSLAVSVWVLLLASPSAAIDRAKLQEFFAAPYSLGARDGVLPIWPIFKTTSSGDELIAYVFEFTDFEPAPDASNAGIDRLVAVRPSGEFLEVQAIGAERPAILNWFRRKPVFDFIRRDQAGSLTPEASAGSGASQNAIERSRDYVRARLSIAAEPPGNSLSQAVRIVREPSASTRIALTALIVSTVPFLAALFRWRALVRSPANEKRSGNRKDWSPSSVEFDS